MSHLTLEALARLIDEPPGADEASHLAACGACREELEALREQGEALGALPKMVPPPDSWEEIRVRLQQERLIRSTPRRAVSAWAWRAAAAIVLFVAGGATGYAARGAASAEPGGTVAATVPVPVGQTLASVPSAQDREELTDEVERTQAEFSDALNRFMDANGSTAADPAARLALLDNVLMTAAEALKEAPGDPVINGYYLTTAAQRQAVLRQIAQSRTDPVF